MNRDQLEVLNIVQQTLKGVLLSIAASNPAQKVALATNLQAFAQHPGLDPISRKMVSDLALGLTVAASAGQPKQ